MNPHSNCLGKQEGLNFLSSGIQQALGPGVLKVSTLVSGRSQRTLELLLERRHSKQPRNIQHRNSDLKRAWDTDERLGVHLRAHSREIEFMEKPLQEQRNW